MRYAIAFVLFMGLSWLWVSDGEPQPAPLPALGQNGITVPQQTTAPGQLGVTVPPAVSQGAPAIGGFGAVAVGNGVTVPGNNALGPTALAPVPYAAPTLAPVVPPPPVGLSIPAETTPLVAGSNGNALGEEPGGDG
jgi:hypothetical protein